MKPCPSCGKRLYPHPIQHGLAWSCLRGHGMAVALEVLECTDYGWLLELLAEPEPPVSSGDRRPCPECAKQMDVVHLDEPQQFVALDICRSCRVVWFDAGEYGEVVFRCPVCARPLFRHWAPYGWVHSCVRLHGTAITEGELERNDLAHFLEMLREAPDHAGGEARRPCPACRRPMCKVDFPLSDGQVPLDRCTEHGLVWFDRSEFKVVAKHSDRQAGRTPGPGPDEPLQVADLAGADSMMQFLAGIFLLPVEFGPNRIRSFPLVTWSLVFLMLLVPLIALLTAGFEWFGFHGGASALAFKGSEYYRFGGVTLLTSLLILKHGWQLAPAAYFILVFGDNVEDDLGHWRFLLLFIGAHIAGLAAHAVRWPEIPCSGASAAVAGVLAYYGIAFYRSPIGLLGPYAYFRFLRVPAYVALLLYLVIQIAGIHATWGAVFPPVSFTAHLGGFAVGAVLAVVGYVLKNRTRSIVRSGSSSS